MEVKNILYDKETLVKMVSSMLRYFDNQENKDEIIKAAQILMTRIKESSDKVELDSELLESILFTQNEDGTKNVVKDVFFGLKSIGTDMSGVSFDNVHISGLYFNNLKNVEINIDRIPNKDISKTSFNGVKVYGSLEGAKVNGTDFSGYIGNLTLNPQTVQDKNLCRTYLNGIKINGSFDGVCVIGMDTEGFKGEIIINPEKVKDKNLSYINFEGVRLVGRYDEKNNTYEDACFDDCSISGCSFKGCIGRVLINLDKIVPVLILTNLTGTELIGTGEYVNTSGTYYEDEDGKKIYLDKKDKLESQEKVKNHKSIFAKLKSKIYSK